MKRGRWLESRRSYTSTRPVNPRGSICSTPITRCSARSAEKNWPMPSCAWSPASGCDCEYLPHAPRTDDGKHVFRREGEYWTLAYDGTVCRVRDSKGLQHIGLLLRHPGQHFDARELVAESVGSRASADRLGAAQLGADGLSVAGLGDAGTVLDATAKAAYRRRVEERTQPRGSRRMR